VFAPVVAPLKIEPKFLAQPGTRLA